MDALYDFHFTGSYATGQVNVRPNKYQQAFAN